MSAVINVQDLTMRIGARQLVAGATFRVGKGIRIGLVGRNGAGKTTLTRILSGESLPAAGSVTRSGLIGYLPQDPRTGDLEQLAKDRILSARGLDQILRRLSTYSMAMATSEGDEQDKAMASYSRAEAELAAAGGYPAEAEAARIAANLGLPDRVLGQPLRTLSGGQRRRVELARILFSGADTLLLDEPTNHLDADSIVWLRSYLQSYSGGLLVISHDVGLLEATVNKVFHLDANRAELDQYAMDWKRYLLQRETDEKRRKRERANAERKAEALLAQADKMRARTWPSGPSGCCPGLTSSGPATRWPGSGCPSRHPAARRRSRPTSSASPTARWRSSRPSIWPSIAARRSWCWA